MFDVTSLRSLKQVGRFDRGGRVVDMDFEWPYVYLADVLLGLQVIDVSTPTTPGIIFESDLNGEFLKQIDVEGNMAVVGTSSDKAMFVDISDQANPIVLGSYMINESIVDISALAIDLSSQQAFVGVKLRFNRQGASSIRRLDFSDSFNPVLIEEIAIFGTTTDLQVDGGQLIAVSESGALRHFDIKEDSHAVLLSKLSFPYDTNAVFVDDDRAYIAHKTTKFAIVDVLDLQSPLPGGIIEHWDDPTSIVIEGNKLYLENRVDGLVIMDITDPHSPTVLGVYKTFIGDNQELIVENDVIYMARDIVNVGESVQIVDASNPESPVLIAEISFEDSVREMKLHNDILYVVHGFFNSPRVFDVSDPATPIELDFPESFTAAGVAVDGDTAYFTTFSDEVYQFDISNPAAPIELGVQYVGRASRRVHIMGDILLIGLDIYRIAADGALEFLSVLPHPQGELEDVHIVGQRVYTASRSQGVYIFDLTDPANPKRLAQYIPENGYFVNCIEVVGETVFIPRTGEQGVLLLDTSNMCNRSCAADLTGDNVLDFFDVAAFLEAFAINDPAVDFTNDGIFDFFDVAAFLEAFVAGCP